MAIELNPHLILMDIEMPVKSGIDAAAEILETNPDTKIIFVTAYADFMPQAFEIYAYDYILKPFKLHRLRQSIDRVKNQMTDKTDKLDDVIIEFNGEIAFEKPNDILIIQREERHTGLITKTGKLKTTENLSKLIERLPPSLFFRSHRSYIINISGIKKIIPYGRWTYLVKFKGIDDDALLTKERYGELKRKFKFLID